MALIDLDSFDHYTTADVGKKTWTYLGDGSSTTITITTGGRNSTNCMQILDTANNQSDSIAIRGHAALGTVFYGVAFKTVSAWGAAVIDGGDFNFKHIYLLQANSPTLAFTVVSTGAIYVFRLDGAAATYLGSTSGGLVTSNVWHYIEIKAVISNTVGAVTVRVNGVEELALTNIDTRGSSLIGDFVDGIGLSCPDNADQAVWYDDLYICDSTGSAPWNGFLGDIHVKALLPDADGTYTAWTPSAAVSHYTLVDDAYNALDTTTYVESSTSAQKDSYGFPALNIDSTTILGVQMNYLANKDDSGSTTINALSRISSTDYTSANLPVTTGQSYSRHIWQVSPATSTNWTESEIDGAEFGMQIT